jgi:hypothetical protein
MKDLQQINLTTFVQVNQKIEDVSRQLTGWQRAQVSHDTNKAV